MSLMQVITSVVLGWVLVWVVDGVQHHEHNMRVMSRRVAWAFASVMVWVILEYTKGN